MKRYRHRIHVFASRAHKWLALFIGAQLLIWFASGALMSFLPIDQEGGEHLVARDTPNRPPRIAFRNCPDVCQSPLHPGSWQVVADKRL